MLYFFPGDLVLDPETNQCCGEGTNQNLMFSPYDVLYLNSNYPLKKAKMTSEQFTVKFFNDVFNQQVDIEDLKKQLNSTRDDENKSSSSSKPEKEEEEEKAPSAQHALKQPGDTGTGAKKASPQFALSQNDSSSSSSSSGSMLEMCKASCLNYSEIILASILFLIIVLLVIVIIVFVIHR